MPWEIVRLPNGQDVLVPSGRHPLPMPQSSYAPPQVYPQYQDYPQQYRPKRRRKLRRPRLSGAAKLSLFFVLSWVPAGMGMAGGTLLAWGFIVVWLCCRAFKEA